MRNQLRALVTGLAFVSSSAVAQTQAGDTSRARTAYTAVTALRNDIERSHGRFVTVNGIRMHYLEWGNPAGVPFVWAHGPASSALELRAVAPRLAEAGYRVLAVDYRGHGLTRVNNYDFSVHDIADDLVGMLDQLKIPAAVFGGASKGGFVSAAVYDHYPNRVLGLLMADGGTFSIQWVFERQSDEEARQRLEDPIPVITGASEFDVFRRMVGNAGQGEIQAEPLLDLLMRIGPTQSGQWAFLPDFDRLIAPNEMLVTGSYMTRPTTLPMLTWSANTMIPRAVFRRLHVPMMILDPQSDRDVLPVTDQNERLAKDHPDLVTHRVYAQTRDNVVRAKPDWFVRDAVALLDGVRKRKPPAERF